MENTREELINGILFVDDLVLMSESTKNLKEKFLKWKEAFESKELKVNLKKIKMMVSGSKVRSSRVKLIHVPSAARG